MIRRHPSGRHAHECRPSIPKRSGFFYKQVASVAALVLSVAPPTLLRADQSDDFKQLRDEIHALEQKLLVFERKQEIRNETAAVPPAPKVTVSDKGFTVVSADGANSIKLLGLVQLDSRLFFGDDGQGIVNNAFVLRRARISAVPILRQDEEALFTRFQVSF